MKKITIAFLVIAIAILHATWINIIPHPTTVQIVLYLLECAFFGIIIGKFLAWNFEITNK
jgi:hypothetical protein